jgi:LAGLIDADG DNA endonuclease family
MNNNKNENFNKLSLKKGPNNKLLREYKMKLNNLSLELWEISIGLMLGDASLQTQNKGKTYRLKFEWGDKNKLYAEHIHTIFNEWILSPPYKKIRVNVNGNTVISWSFQTFSHSAFNPLKDLFLINKHKGIANNLIHNHLTPRGLAYWWMDDGGKLDYNKNSKNQVLVLNTHSFMKEEVEMLSNELALKFNLNTCLRLNKNKYIIVIKHDSYKTFINLTDSYIIPSMRYKLPS